MPVPNTLLISTLVTTFHDHDLPLCDGGKHNLSCKKYKREHECIHVTVRDKKTGKPTKEYARCFHFYVK